MVAHRCPGAMIQVNPALPSYRSRATRAWNRVSASRPSAAACPGVKPALSGRVFVKITPEVISILDYRKGFGHTELVRVDAAGLHG
jgi:hypothetical protein